MMNNWQRLEQVINWAGMSTNAFAKAVGLKRSENLYQIKRGSFGISRELARLITVKYPMVNRVWLLTGEGGMLTKPLADNNAEQIIASSEGAIPFYQVDVTSLVFNTIKPLYYLVLPMFKGATMAAICAGNAMCPTINSGSIVVLRETSVAAILPGEIYMVATSDFVVLRRLRTIQANSNELLLAVENREQFDDIAITKDAINRIFIVVGVISSNQM